MTFSQRLMTWSLRGLVAWAIAEGVLWGTETLAEQREGTERTKIRTTVVARLERRAASANQAAHRLEANIQRLPMGTVDLRAGGTPHQIVFRSLRNDLVNGGAQAPEINVELGPVTRSYQRVSVQMSWESAAPVALAQLSSWRMRRSYLRVSHVEMRRLLNGNVRANVRGHFLFRVTNSHRPATSPLANYPHSTGSL